MNIYFEKTSLSHIDIIFSWLSEPFVQEFWDNTQGHKDDILNFVNGRKESSNYCDGKYVYWIASCDGYPFAMLMTIQETVEAPIEDIKLNHLSKTACYGERINEIADELEDKNHREKVLKAFHWPAIDALANHYKLSLRILLKVIPLESTQHLPLQKAATFLRDLFKADKALSSIKTDTFPLQFITVNWHMPFMVIQCMYKGVIVSVHWNHNSVQTGKKKKKKSLRNWIMPFSGSHLASLSKKKQNCSMRKLLQ